MKRLDFKNGYWFTGYINDSRVQGRIRRVGSDIYFCQNTKNGSDCGEELRYGYRFSWVVSTGEKHIEEAGVHDVQIFKEEPVKPTFLKNTLIKRRIMRYHSQLYPEQVLLVGCTRVPLDVLKKVVTALGKESKKATTKYKESPESSKGAIAVKLDSYTKIMVHKGAGAVPVSSSEYGKFIPYKEIKEIAKLLKVK